MIFIDGEDETNVHFTKDRGTFSNNRTFRLGIYCYLTQH